MVTWQPARAKVPGEMDESWHTRRQRRNERPGFSSTTDLNSIVPNVYSMRLMLFDY